MRSMAKRRWKKPQVLEAELRDLFTHALDPPTLRRHVEELAGERAFPGLVSIWGPELYRRQRILFLPFLRAHFHPQNIRRWKGTQEKELERWLSESEANEDWEFFRQLYRRKFELLGWGFSDWIRTLWSRDLVQRLRQARSAEERDRLLACCDLGLMIELDAALAVAEIDSAGSRTFLYTHFPFASIRRWTDRLEAWMQRTESDSEPTLFLALYRRKMQLQGWEVPAWIERAWRRDILRRLGDTRTSPERQRVLRYCDLRLRLDEDAALTLSQIDAEVARPFILSHLPKWPDRLREWARRQGDEPFYLSLYRRSAPRSEWLTDIKRLCDMIPEPGLLCAALDARHSELHRLTFLDVLRLLQRRGEDILPYVRRIFGQIVADWPSHYTPLLRLAEERGWIELWTGLILRHAWNWDYQRTLQRILADPDLAETTVRQRVLLLCNADCDDLRALGGRYRSLSDRTAVALYRRFPDLLTGVLRSHVRWGGADAYPRLTAAARAVGDAALWGALMRDRSSPEKFESDLLSVIQDRSLDDSALQQKLLAQLAGVSGEWSGSGVGLIQVRQLTDKVAFALYQRQPALLRGAFRKHVMAGYGQPYPLLTMAVLEAGDVDLIDYLASRLVTRPWLGWLVAGAMKGVVEKLSRHYEDLVERPDEFVRRSIDVLGQIPPYSIAEQSYHQLIRNNRLARLLFERSAAIYLEHPLLLRDLLESPEIHVQILALRALGLEDSRVHAIAADNLDLLLPMLLRSLHRRTRLLAFRALLNAGGAEDHARLILDRARQALDLPEQHYPREALIALIGKLLKRWPGLCGASEQPRIFMEKMT
jgi:hypothetical protein